MAVDELVVDFCISETFGRYLPAWFDLGGLTRLGRVVRVLARHCLHVLDGSSLLFCIRTRFRTAACGDGEHHG